LALLLACDGGSTAPFHRDGSLQFETIDLSLPLQPDGAARDLAARDGAAPDLAGGDLASGGACATVVAALSYDFEASNGGFSHQASDGFAGDPSWPFDEWAWGTPSGSGPNGCHGGSKCWGTYLPGNYANCERGELATPSIDLSACASTALKLSFWQWFDFWTGSYSAQTWYDGGLVEISADDGATWSPPTGITYARSIAINPDRGPSYACLSSASFHVDAQPGFTTSSGGWMQVTFDIPASFRVQKFRVRWSYASGVVAATTDPDTSRLSARPGWYLDDVAVQIK
jgi:hypothetical protein